MLFSGWLTIESYLANHNHLDLDQEVKGFLTDIKLICLLGVILLTGNFLMHLIKPTNDYH